VGPVGLVDERHIDGREMITIKAKYDIVMVCCWEASWAWKAIGIFLAIGELRISSCVPNQGLLR